MKQNKNERISTATNPETFDPMGSYTGVARDPLEKPVQDADDL